MIIKDMETILGILQWAIPTGGIGVAIGWLVNRKVNNAKAKKEIHDTFKQMYEDVSATLLKLQKENEKLNENVQELRDENSRIRRALNRLSKAIEAIPLCDYHIQCPVLSELRIDKGGDGNGIGGAVGKSDPEGQREARLAGKGSFSPADSVGDRFPSSPGIIPDGKPSGNGRTEKETRRKRHSGAADG